MTYVLFLLYLYINSNFILYYYVLISSYMNRDEKSLCIRYYTLQEGTYII